MPRDIDETFGDIRYSIPAEEVGLERAMEISEKLRSFLEDSSVEMYLSRVSGVKLYEDATMLIPLEIDGYRIVYPVTLSGR